MMLRFGIVSIKTMKIEHIPEVAEHYTTYLDMLNGDKQVDESPITLRRKKTNEDRLIAKTVLQHDSFSEGLELIVEASSWNRQNFGFKIRALSLSSVPCFRFDGDGPAHNNVLPDVPLSARQVTTPHFHKCQKNGFLIAYKTPALLSQGDARALQMDINLAVAHFCQEAKITHPSETYPKIDFETGELAISPPEFDPLSGVSFDV